MDNCNAIHITVKDDGIGMKDEELAYLKGIIAGEKKPSADNSGFGMANVTERMRLNYGTHCGINIDSEYGSGTQVEIIIPKQTEKIDSQSDKNEQKL